jgi:hypothetical protein
MSLPEALESLRKAEKQLKKKKTYENAVALQVAQRNFEIERKKAFNLLEEDDATD